MRACEEEDGIPTYQVMRFHAIAPINTPSTTVALTTVTSTSPAPIVLATAVPKTKAATKLKKAAQKTAMSGVSTRVDTTVAIEFAESCMPLMKSNTSATATIASTKIMRAPLLDSSPPPKGKGESADAGGVAGPRL